MGRPASAAVPTAGERGIWPVPVATQTGRNHTTLATARERGAAPRPDGNDRSLGRGAAYLHDDSPPPPPGGRAAHRAPTLSKHRDSFNYSVSVFDPSAGGESASGNLSGNVRSHPKPATVPDADSSPCEQVLVIQIQGAHEGGQGGFQDRSVATLSPETLSPTPCPSPI